MVKHIQILGKTLAALALLLNPCASLSQAQQTRNTSSQDEKRVERFEKQVEDLRNRLKIPGMSAAIVKDQKVLWAEGFGFADLEKKIPATPNTLFHLASVTKTFAATLIMQLVEQGKLSLDEPMSRYSTEFKNDSVKIKHVITHTSGGTPGERFAYDGQRFDYLTAVIEKKTGKRFAEVVVETFFDPLGMSRSVPYHNIAVDSGKWIASLGKERLDRYKKSLETFAQPYTYYGNGEILPDSYPYPDYLGAAAGLLSTVLDMAKYDIAIDRHRFIRKETQQRAWTPFISNSGTPIRYGLGWFITDYHGLKLVWHYGHWGTGFTAIYLKVPQKNVSLVLLANSEALADHQFQGGEDITNNVFACSFLSLWDVAYDCDKNSQSAVTKWIEHRRATGRVAINVDPKVLEPYVGQYQFETLGNRIITILREGDKLFMSEGSKTGLFAESDSTFFVKGRSYLLIFTKGEGQPAQLKIVQDQNVYLSKKIQ